MNITMGERIKQLRKMHKMTQAELGDILGVGRSAILKYEKNEVEDIPASKIKKMSVIFNVSPSYLMCFDKYNEEQLAQDVILIEKIQARWGKPTVTILDQFLSLNDEGKIAVLNYIEDLSALPKYQKVQGSSR